ncbi:MAG TPA: hypothetical protein VH592_05870 [Gemmataceae bacterium]|jgi:uncharacterized coiled-coil protein SlyX
MRSKVVKTLTFTLMLCGVSMSAAQQAGSPQGGVRPQAPGSPDVPRPQKVKAAPDKSKLEDMLAEALRNNPDIRVAAAKLAEAEAKLNRTRVQVTQQVVTLYQSIVSQRALVEVSQKKYDRLTELVRRAAVDPVSLDEASATLTVAKAKLAELEAQMPGLLGKVQKSPEARAATSLDPRFLYHLDLDRDWELHLKVDPNSIGVPQAKANILQGDRIRKALQTPVKVDYKDMTVTDILKDLEKKAPGLSFHIRDVPRVAAKGGDEEAKPTLHFDTPLPVASVLQAIKDSVGSHFIVRDYGILVTSLEQPRGAMSVEQFLRQKPDSNEHKEARHFINSIWPTLDFARLEDNIPTAQKAFQTCMDVGDRDSIRGMLGVTLGHVIRLRKRKSELHPELVIDDQKEAQRLEKVGEKIAKLVADMQFCLKEWER